MTKPAAPDVSQTVSASQTLILASGSPRRRELLTGLGVPFEVRAVDIDESPMPGEAPERYVRRLAVSKAVAASEGSATHGEIFLAADTIVAAEGDLLGKPRDNADARRMLERLSARSHEVLTGVAVLDPARQIQVAGVERTRVRFAALSPEEIAWYADSGEPLDKAGAYAVQGLGALFVKRLEGNYSNVVGLPLPLTYRLLSEVGFSLRI